MSRTVLIRTLDLGLKCTNVISNDLHWKLSKTIYQTFCKRAVHGYDSTIDPYKLHTVSPDEITEITRRKVPFHTNRWDLLGSVMGGDWDQRGEFVFSSEFKNEEWFNTVFTSIEFTECLFYQAMDHRFNKGKDWFETDYIKAVLTEIEEGNPVWHSCKDIQDVRERCEYIDNLYEAIKTNGYETQRELGMDFKTALTQEVMVDISRDGQLLFVDGRHRLAIAKLLDLDKIPVSIGFRHEKIFESQNHQS